MNCIFITIFLQIKYVEMFFILLESLSIFGNLDINTEILIYTSTKFMNIIKQSHLYTDKIKFEINDDYDNLDKACKSRLDLFNLHSIQNYESGNIVPDYNIMCNLEKILKVKLNKKKKQ